MIRVYRTPFSTNVERVALGAAHKQVEVEWVDVDPADRSAVIAVSGQELVPVMEAPDGEVVSDSMAILAWLERRVPQPALWPDAARARAQADVAVEWFNGVWKGPPNAIDRELGAPEPDESRIAAWSRQLGDWLPRFEAMLEGRAFLLGETLGVFDVCAFPFLKYSVIEPDPGDEDRFHRVLHDHQRQAREMPRLKAWIARVDGLPRA